ncbi:uracil-DNA glycosylase [Sanyastnella coralliicola]|uniref:uracil-DNA glycosylase n=1 Tax=Sanyastnella coralliicola TaxID=3069118 RepID=UPI0027B999F0|nr:uracil-DNA glycosylase [Longitalea sp. SCSIO 12813]
MNVRIEEGWKEKLQQEFEKEYFTSLTEFIKQEYSTTRCFPPGSQIFSAFDHCHFDNVKVVILGQDPYIRPGQANGMCFSVADGIQHPPSLQNIFKEINEDLGIPAPASGDLSRWAKQGVFLLNATLTVREGQSGSHQGQGWEQFTDAVIHAINDGSDHVVFMLWGSFAQKKASFVDQTKHLVLKAPHPSPLSAYRGFFGCKHFSKANAWLESKGKGKINW